MGRLNKEVSFIKNVVDTKFEMTTNQYNRFLDNAPVFVTYYKQNTIESTVDVGLQNINSFMGDESPIKYNKVKDVPMYGLNVTSIDINDDEVGIAPSFATEAVIPPGIFTPIPNDYFRLDYLGKNYLFKVTDVDTDTIKSNHYYKISFKFNKVEDDAIIDKQVADDFTVIFDNIGTEDKAIIKDDMYEKVMRLSEVITPLRKNYIECFYSRKFKAFLYNKTMGSKTLTIYDKQLATFIINNKVLIDDSDYNSLFGLRVLIRKEKDFTKRYKNSMFGMIERGRINEVVYSHLFPVHINEPMSILYDYMYHIHDAMYCEKDYLQEVICPIYDDLFFIEKITKNELYDDDIIKNCIISYMNNNNEYILNNLDEILMIQFDELEADMVINGAILLYILIRVQKDMLLKV